MLLIQLPQEQIDQLMEEIENNPEGTLDVDLENQTITRGNRLNFTFEIDPFRKHCLINGLDDIGLTEEKAGDIASFEKQDQDKRSWLYAS